MFFTGYYCSYHINPLSKPLSSFPSSWNHLGWKEPLWKHWHERIPQIKTLPLLGNLLTM